MIVGAGSVSVDYLVEGLQSMARNGHTDGWGGVHREDGRLVVRKSIASCLEDFAFEAYSSVVSDLFAFHARRSPPQSRVSADFTHPFAIGSDYYVFHNTWLKTGERDPRRLVNHLRRFLKPGEEEASLLKAMAELRDFVGANCVVASPHKVVVATCFDPASSKAPYYQMVYSAGTNDVVVSSERLLGRSWVDLPNRSVIALYPNGKYELNRP